MKFSGNLKRCNRGSTNYGRPSRSARRASGRRMRNSKTSCEGRLRKASQPSSRRPQTPRRRGQLSTKLWQIWRRSQASRRPGQRNWEDYWSKCVSRRSRYNNRLQASPRLCPRPRLHHQHRRHRHHRHLRLPRLPLRRLLPQSRPASLPRSMEILTGKLGPWSWHSQKEVAAVAAEGTRTDKGWSKRQQQVTNKGPRRGMGPRRRLQQRQPQQRQDIQEEGSNLQPTPMNLMMKWRA